MTDPITDFLMQPSILQLAGTAITVIGAILGIKHYKGKFHKIVNLVVKIDAAWADDKFTDEEIKEIVDAALAVADKEPINTNPGV